MEWLLDNLKLVIFVIVIVVYALKAMRERPGEDEPGGPVPPPRRTLEGEEDAAEAERTRQIQEEIRRRILARQRGETAPAEPPPIVVEQTPPPIPPTPPAPALPVEVSDPYQNREHEIAAQQAAQEAAILEAQRALEEQLRAARRLRESAYAGMPPVPAATTAATAAPPPGRSTVRHALRQELAGRSSVRRAMLLREILGEPVALRPGPAGVTRR